ncbi:MAG: hypothetical protein GXO70_00100, partial [Acidobacteria bacterium]|nr:hypothetical protein [Acidobacteriota bacterium]
MNRVRRIQLFLLIVMLVLIAVVIGNFNRGRIQEPVKTPDIKPASQPIASGGTRMERGIHVLYRDGSPYATVHFKEAIQEKDRVHLSSPVLQITGIPGKVTADSAVVQGNIVVLTGKITLLSSKDGISVALAPPATLQDGILTGMDTFEAKMNNGVFKGKGYELRIADNELIGKTHTQFNSSRESFSIQSKTGIANLKEKTLTFVQQVRLTPTENTGFETTTDAAFLNNGTERLSLVGRGK